MPTSRQALLVLVLAFSACAPQRPQLFPNDKFRSVQGTPELTEDINYCTSLADQYVQDKDRYGEIAKDTAIGGVAGAGAGAVAGAIFGNAGRGTGAGAAAGAIAALLQGLIRSNEPSPSYQRFVEYCL
jgi:outer membrane lipoprotein SlyB